MFTDLELIDNKQQIVNGCINLKAIEQVGDRESLQCWFLLEIWAQDKEKRIKHRP